MRMGSQLGSCSLVFLIFLVSIQGNESSRRLQSNFYPDEPPVKTFQSEDGQDIDCVNIYSQPAFAHPSLRGHKFQMKPSSFPVDMLKDVPLAASNLTAPKLSFGGNETCPEGTVPIFGGPQDPNIVTKSYGFHGEPPYSTEGHEYAVARLQGSKYYGSGGMLNIWNPRVEANQGFSLAQLWVVSSPGDNVNTIEAGWHVYPNFYSGDARTRLFIYWTSDGYRKTGCYNLKCPGFVQVSRMVAPGVPLPASVYQGTQTYMRILVYRDPKTGHWWLRIGTEWMGYWPKTIFTSLASGATILEWGGEIINQGTSVHTGTDMGSGHFPSEGGDGISASFNSLNYIDQTYVPRKPSAVSASASRPKCYNIKVLGDVRAGNRGFTFFFGGPGRNANCP